MKCKEVKKYYVLLEKKRVQLSIKRLFDVIVSLSMLIILAIPMIVIAIMIKLDSSGPIFYRQERVTAYGKIFRIHKFRTMVSNADKIGSNVTRGGDFRITKVGNKLRNLRLDELPQLIDVFWGDMSFVGTRPEAIEYVKQYKPEYYATLLLPAGITSKTSIKFRNEAELLVGVENVDSEYVNHILPKKMKLNLQSIREFSVINDLLTMIMTVITVIFK